MDETTIYVPISGLTNEGKCIFADYDKLRGERLHRTDKYIHNKSHCNIL